MYVRDAKNREEVWLLDQIEAMGLDDTAFRSRDYVVAIDEETGEKAGFGRIRIHKNEEEPDRCELTSVGVLEQWRDQGVGAHVIERLIEYAGDDEFEEVYALSSDREYLEQFGFEQLAENELPDVLTERLSEKRDRLDPEAEPLVIEVEDFRMSADLRDAFKRAGEQPPEGEEDDESAEDFGIDPDSATYKYDTGR